MKNLILIFSILFSLTIYAQLPSNNNFKTGVVYGKVIDATSNETLPYVSIIIKDATNKITTGGITDDDGNFTIKQIMCICSSFRAIF